jgi:hypothetical protein
MIGRCAYVAYKLRCRESRALRWIEKQEKKYSYAADYDWAEVRLLFRALIYF